jgi:hypothetical protein
MDAVISQVRGEQASHLIFDFGLPLVAGLIVMVYDCGAQYD